MVKIVQNYTLTKVIGQGQYGKVYKATHIDSKMEVAIKIIKVEKFSEISKLTDCMKNQIETLMLIQDNINIIKFVEMIKTANNIYLVYEYCEGGTLQEQIRINRQMPEKKALLYFRQLLNAFKALAQNNIMHRDIKPDNILIKSGHLKLADFGFCKRMSSMEELTQTVLGSPIYMAPQVLNGDLYNSKAEVWSLGIVLYEMLFGYTPFSEGNISDLLFQIDNFRIQIPSDSISSITEGLLKRMVEKDQFRRISWEDLFYEYDVTEYGVLMRKEKGFEYDLMKLIKKNSVSQPKAVKNINFKFNWDKITDGKSSVRSQQLQQYQKNGNIDRIVNLKRKIKDYNTEHTKITIMASALTDVIRRKYCQQSQIIGYFVSANMKLQLQQLIKSINTFNQQEYGYLQVNNNQNEEVRRLLHVLTQEKNQVIPKLNDIKLFIFSNEKVNKEIFKYPDSKIRNKYIQKYINNIVQKYPYCQSFQENYELDRSITAHLLRLLIALNFNNQKDAVVVDQTLEKLKLVKMLHIRKRQLGL